MELLISELVVRLATILRTVITGETKRNVNRPLLFTRYNGNILGRARLRGLGKQYSQLPRITDIFPCQLEDAITLYPRSAFVIKTLRLLLTFRRNNADKQSTNGRHTANRPQVDTSATYHTIGITRTLPPCCTIRTIPSGNCCREFLHSQKVSKRLEIIQHFARIP